MSECQGCTLCRAGDKKAAEWIDVLGIAMEQLEKDAEEIEEQALQRAVDAFNILRPGLGLTVDDLRMLRNMEDAALECLFQEQRG